MREKELTCRECHRYLRVGRRDACDRVPGNSRQPYRFLDSLEICRHFWLIKRLQPRRRQRGKVNAG